MESPGFTTENHLPIEYLGGGNLLIIGAYSQEAAPLSRTCLDFWPSCLVGVGWALSGRTCRILALTAVSCVEM